MPSPPVVELKKEKLEEEESYRVQSGSRRRLNRKKKKKKESIKKIKHQSHIRKNKNPECHSSRNSPPWLGALVGKENFTTAQ